MSRQIEAGSTTLSCKTCNVLILLSVLESVTARKERVYVPVYKESSKVDCRNYLGVSAKVTSYSSAKFNSMLVEINGGNLREFGRNRFKKL
jgi:hypothetical protein